MLSQSIWKYETFLNRFSWAHFRTYAFSSFAIAGRFNIFVKYCKTYMIVFFLFFSNGCFLCVKCSFSRFFFLLKFFVLFVWLNRMKHQWYSVSFALLPLYRFEIPFDFNSFKNRLKRLRNITPTANVNKLNIILHGFIKWKKSFRFSSQTYSIQIWACVFVSFFFSSLILCFVFSFSLAPLKIMCVCVCRKSFGLWMCWFRWCLLLLSF